MLQVDDRRCGHDSLVLTSLQAPATRRSGTLFVQPACSSSHLLWPANRQSSIDPLSDPRYNAMPLFVYFAASSSPALGSHMPPPRSDLALLARLQLAAHMAHEIDFASKDLDFGRHAVSVLSSRLQIWLHLIALRLQVADMSSCEQHRSRCAAQKIPLKPMWHLSLKATCTPLPITMHFDNAFRRKPLLPRALFHGRLLQSSLW